MTHADLEKMVDSIAAQAEQEFLRDGEHQPLAFAPGPKGLVIGAIRVQRPAERRAAFEMLCGEGAEAIVFITEAWLASAPAGSAEYAALRRHTATGGSLETLTGRREMLLVIGACPEGTTGRAWQIHREGGRVVLSPQPFAPMAAGILVGLPWR